MCEFIHQYKTFTFISHVTLLNKQYVRKPQMYFKDLNPEFILTSGLFFKCMLKTQNIEPFISDDPQFVSNTSV